MNRVFSKLVTKTRQLGLLFTVLSAARGKCSASDIEAIYARIPDPDTKNRGYDLRGWTYETVVSRSSGETYRYYHLPSKRPDAPVFLLVHGLFLDGRTFIDFGPLAEAFELVAVELPHDSPFYTGRRKDFSALLQDFIDAKQFESLYLGGVSLGGHIAMYYLSENPVTPVRGLALISTDMIKTERELARGRRGARAISALTGDDDGRMLCMLNKITEKKRAAASGEAARAFEVFQLKHPSFYREVIAVARNMDTIPRLAAIDIPTVIIHGDADSTVSIAGARRLVDHIPHAVFHTIEGGEHTVAYTRGAQVAEIIRTFFC